jgi:hypothetical protein
MILKDRFGIEMLHPTTSGGREWSCNWDNGNARGLKSGDKDQDPEFHFRGTGGAMSIDGRGIARVSGETPRLYVYAEGKTWRNVEVTFYARRVGEYAVKSSQGFVVGARSEHQAIKSDPCNAHTYYGRLLYDGRANFIKEFWHDEANGAIAYTDSKPVKEMLRWNPPNPELPYGEWIGMKYVVRNLAGNTLVLLELYRDRSGGMGTGQWEPVIHLDDTGGWSAAATPCTGPSDRVFTDAATSVFIRNDFLVAAEYARFSIREIAPV